MDVPLRPWQLVLLAVCASVAAVGLAALVRARTGTSPVELTRYLPAGDSVVLSIDLAALRQAGLLDLLAGAKAVEEPEYASFVQETGFDYREDLDAVLACFRDKETYFLLTGRFDWTRLNDYARQQRGTCWNGFCRLPASTADRTISYFALKPRIMALAVGRREWAVSELAPRRRRGWTGVPARPVWLSVPAAILRDSELLPAGARSFAGALRGAERVALAMGPLDGAFEISLDAACASAGDAARIAGDLETATTTLRKLVAGENRTPNPAELSGVLAAGSFSANNRRVAGRWRVERVFLEAIAGGKL